MCAKITNIKKDISSLACYAAIEIDDLIHDKKREVDASKQLLDIIRDESQTFSPTTRSFFYGNPSAIVLMSQAIRNSEPEFPTSVKNLAQEVSQIISKLERITNNAGTIQKDDLKKIRNFCLGLSKWARNQKMFQYSRGQQHPYKSLK